MKNVLPGRSRALISTGFAVLLAATMTVSAEDNANNSRRSGQGREKLKERILQRFDANHNGVLDPDEKDALKKAIAQRRSQHGQTGQGGRSGGRRGELLKKRGTNGHGKLDATERPDAKADLQERRAGHQQNNPAATQ